MPHPDPAASRSPSPSCSAQHERGIRASPIRAQGPIPVIDSLHAALLDVMKNATSSATRAARRSSKPVIPRYFDVAFMAEKSVGPYWKRATEAERERYLDAFLRFMVANYAGQFDGWDGQTFETLGEEPARMDTRDRAHAGCSIRRTRTSSSTTACTRPPEGWKIIDVYLDGTVSELALRRSEFSGIVKRENFDALIAALDAKIAKLASGKS